MKHTGDENKENYQPRDIVLSYHQILKTLIKEVYGNDLQLGTKLAPSVHHKQNNFRMQI